MNWRYEPPSSLGRAMRLRWSRPFFFWANDTLVLCVGLRR
jgi:hypothetical protein